MSSGLLYAIGGFYGGSIGNLLSYWEQAGFFTYVLPFLLIFAIVLGILTRTNIFGTTQQEGVSVPRTGLNAVIALSVGLLSLQFDFVPMFFAEIFPRLGIGLSVILTFFILVGLFLPSGKSKHMNWMLFAAAAVVFIFVIGKSFGGFYWWNSIYAWYNYAPEIFTTILIVVGVGAVIASVSGRQMPDLPRFKDPYWQGGP